MHDHTGLSKTGAAMSCPDDREKISVVRFMSGEQDGPSWKLRRALVHHFHSCVTDSTSKENATILSLSNKYLDAKVRFADIGETQHEEGTSIVLDEVEDGIILTFPDSKSNASAMRESFDSVQNVHSLAQSLQQCGDLLRLCVGIDIDGETQPIDETLLEEERQRRILWCLDRGYEYIDADMSEEGMRIGHDDREKEGYARILEAFQATIWSSAIKKESKKEIHRETRTGKDMDSVKKDEFQQEASDPKQQRHVHADEAYFNNLDRVVKDAVRIRDEARSGTLTDEERRKRAGEAAIALMGLLGLDEDEEDSDME